MAPVVSVWHLRATEPRGTMIQETLGFGWVKRDDAVVATTRPKETTMTTTLDQRINALKPGQDIRLSGDDAVWVTAERSGNGQWLRFVRHTGNGFTVFKTTRF